MREDYAEIGIVLDCSSSMECIKGAVIEGYNSFIDMQKKVDGKCVVTLTKFSSNVMIGKPTLLENIKKMTSKTYAASGMTALWKAISDTVDAMGQRLANMPEAERPEKVLVVIITDGEENASNSSMQFSLNSEHGNNMYTLDKLKEKIEHQKQVYNWEFIFIGAENLDVENISTSMGIGHTVSFQQNDCATRSMYSALSDTVGMYRNSGKISS